METVNERRFYNALGIVPEVPNGILEAVERRGRRGSVVRRIALAACLALAFIVPALVYTNVAPSSAAYADDTDMTAELFYALEYLGGGFGNDDLFDDTELFTSLTEKGFSNED
jgi:hypothetical protein